MTIEEKIRALKEAQSWLADALKASRQAVAMVLYADQQTPHLLHANADAGLRTQAALVQLETAIGMELIRLERPVEVGAGLYVPPFCEHGVETRTCSECLRPYAVGEVSP